MAFEFLGGGAHCGRPWDRFGAPYALVDCEDHQTGTNPARGGAVRAPDPRPGRLADLPGLAGARLAHPRGHLLQVDGALLARRPATVRQPARREQPALPALSVRPRRHPDVEELLRRHGLGPAAGAADARAPGLRRRAVGRPRQGLVPHRHQPVAGPHASSTRASWRSSWASRPACPSAARSGPGPPATSPRATPPRSTGSSTRCTRWAYARWSWSTSSTTRCPASPATRGRPASSSTTPTSSRPAATGTWSTASPATPGAHDREQARGARDLRGPAGRAVRCDRPGLRRRRHRPADLPAARPLQPARPHHARRARHRRPRRSAGCSSTPTT